MSDSRPVHLTPSGPPETVLASDPAAFVASLDAALAAPIAERRDAVAAVVARWPSVSAGWATLGDLGRDPVEGYAAYRVGYHRGLDRLRQSGWRGSGYVRWSEPANRGFLRCLAGLAERAEQIGENDERDRCNQFLLQLDPEWPPSGR